ncbi:conserved unknown protein [Ectocarpus siliculosus]|uniref:ubiquitinyl hydrolase 1 n=1 Tax=Ectocarpus siliculosus TaxID=2880 RepID=D7FS31_ECTSI|nr:conserved unknown protein [Ectocarpus siliculosus]|eukprot:CBJ30972.1 conserved unknown protein [Ectocarpus siliculosus]
MPSTTTEGGMPVVTVKVSSFLKHPAAGHTLYECRVELPHTRQVWVVHRRYREFVALRQHLKTACQHYRQKKPAPSSRGGKPHPANKPPERGTASLGVGGGVSAAAAGGDGGGSSGGGSSACSRPPGSAELIESIETILFVCKFPSRIPLGRSFSLKQERRKALHSFLEALVYLRPLPNKVASFLGLLENNRLAQDQNGDYVRVMHTETVLPIPPSPAFHAAAHARREKMVADVAPRGGEDDDAAVAGDDGPCGTTPGLRSSKAAATKTLAMGVASAEGRAEEGSDVPAAAAEVATGCSSGSGGGGSENDGRRKASLPLSSPAAAGTAGASGQPLSDHVDSSSPRQHQPPRFRQQEQRSVGSRAWEGVRTVEMESGGGEGQDRWSGTEDPTDSESGSDSETDDDSDDDDGRGTRTAEDTTHVRGDDDTEPRSSPGAGRQQRQGADGGVAHGGADPAAVAEAVATTGLGDENRGGGGSGGEPGVIPDPPLPAVPSPKARSPTALVSPPSTAVPTSPYAPVAKLRGGGADGGGGGEVDCDADGEDETMTCQDEDVDGGGSGDGGGGVGEAEVKGEEDEEREERLIQWEFLNGFLHEVVAKVVGRQGLGGTGSAGGGERGGGGEGGVLSSPLSDEERDVRVAELMSFGVDLPYEMLLTLLRYKDWGPEAATALYQSLVAAGKGLLEKVNPGAPVRGMQNGGNTCYIDSLLFAMFATLDAFDWLLFKPLPSTDPPEVKLLQKHLRFLVNQLREGATIPREHSNLIRTHLRRCGWQGGASTQEDVTELFTFLVCLLRCPALPLSEALFHGGNVDAGDSRISTERALFLALPEAEKETEDRKRPKSLSPTRDANAAPPLSTNSNADPAASSSPATQQQQGEQQATARSPSVPRRGKGKDSGGVGAAVTLEQILMHNFHDNRVEGLRRSVSGEKGSQRYEQPVAPTPAAGAFSRASGTGAAVPEATKSRRRVIVPHRLDVSNFMAPSAGAKGRADKSEPGRFVLVLRSAVCHLGGESVSKGHYVAYTADRVASGDGGGNKKGEAGVAHAAKAGEWASKSTTGWASGGGKSSIGADDGESSQDSVAWLRLDDLHEGPGGRGYVERLDTVHEANRLFSEDLGLHSYMLFYELVPLNLDDAGKAQMKEKLALMETQSDYELALQLDLMERARTDDGGWSQGGGGGRGAVVITPICPVS